MPNRIYLKLSVYNYDASPRWQTIEHECRSIEHAKHVATRLTKLMNWTVRGSKEHHLLGMSQWSNETRNWLQRNTGIDGFVEEILGIFDQTTRKVA